jgi:hypothetical protein
MKKLVIFAVALFLAVPAVTFAGSATSRWDMTIGGYVKADMGWADSGFGLDSYNANRKGLPGARENVASEYGVLGMAAGETRLNFLVKGPDGWGAKTSAFVEFDFRGAGYGNTDGQRSYDTALIRHAFMKFDWANDSLLFGKFWSNFNLIPVPQMPLAFNSFGEAKNNRVVQLKWDHRFSKTVTTALALEAPSNDGLGGTNGYNEASVANSYARSMMPFLSGSIQYKSDACGKIGNTMLTFGGSALIGYTKETGNDPNNNIDLQDKNIKSWGLSTYFIVPIIPEKNNNKAMGWAFSGGAMAYSNIQSILGPLAVDSAAYVRGNTVAEVAPTYYSWWATTNFWVSNKVSLNAYYASTRLASSSQRFKTVTLNGIAGGILPSVNDTYTLNVAYDVNPAIRLMAEAAQIYTQYGNDLPSATPAAGDRGKTNVFRIGAYYFF